MWTKREGGSLLCFGWARPTVTLLMLLLVGASSGWVEVPVAAAEESPARAALLVGEWKVELNAQMKRQVLVAELGLQQPRATDAELKAAGLTAAEQASVRSMATMLVRAPNSPQVAQWHALAELLPTAKLVFSANRRQNVWGTQTVADGTYTVVAVEGARVTLDVVPREAAPMGGLWAPTREVYVLSDANTLLAMEPDSGRHLRYRRVR